MLNTGPARQATVKEKAVTYLQSMPPGTEIAIFELGSELRVVQGFTTDRAVLVAAMNSIHPTTVLNQHAEVPDMYDPAGCPICIAVKQVCELLNRRSETTLDALDEIAAFGSGIKGRKNLIWFMTGLPQITQFQWVSNLLYAMQPRQILPTSVGVMSAAAPAVTLVDDTSDLQRTYGLLNAAQVAISPVDPRGLGGQAGDAAELTIGNVVGGEVAIEEIPQYKQNSFLSMQDMAASTGGIAYYNRNDLDGAIGEAIATGSDYYSLSYVPPPAKYDGKYHKIEVKVDRPGLHLQYREGYTAIDLAKPLPEKNNAKSGETAPDPDSDFHTAVDRGMNPATALVFELQVAPSTTPAKPGDPAALKEVLDPKLSGKPLVRYALMYELPAGEVTLVDGPNGTRKGSLEFNAVAYGDDGVKLSVVRETVNFTLKPGDVDHFIKNPVEMPLQIDLPPGKVDIRVGVLDVPSQKMGTVEFPEEVRKEPTPSFSQDAALAPTAPPAFPQAPPPQPCKPRCLRFSHPPRKLQRCRKRRRQAPTLP